MAVPSKPGLRQRKMPRRVNSTTSAVLPVTSVHHIPFVSASVSYHMPPPNMFVHLCRDGKCAPAQLAPLTHEAPASRAA